MMEITVNDNMAVDLAEALFAGPADCIRQQGLIHMWSKAAGRQKKHVLYALGQRALMELEDGELLLYPHPKGAILSAMDGERKLSLTAGGILYMSNKNRIGLHIHEQLNAAGLVRAFHRYATRMVRLDIRS